MSEIKNGGLNQYGAAHFKQQFGRAGVEGVMLYAANKYQHGRSWVLTSNSWVVKLSWLENANSRPVLSAGDLDE